jgi:hypothetical protein
MLDQPAVDARNVEHMPAIGQAPHLLPDLEILKPTSPKFRKEISSLKVKRQLLISTGGGNIQIAVLLDENSEKAIQ